MVKFDVVSILCCEPAVYIHDKDHPSYKQFHVRAPSDTATPPTRRRRGRGFRENQFVNLLTRDPSTQRPTEREARHEGDGGFIQRVTSRRQGQGGDAPGAGDQAPEGGATGAPGKRG